MEEQGQDPELEFPEAGPGLAVKGKSIKGGVFRMGRPEHVGWLREDVGEGKRLEGSLCPGGRLLCQPLSLDMLILVQHPTLSCHYQVLLSSSHVS